MVKLDGVNLPEKLKIFGVRARPAAFDVINPQQVQFFSNSYFIFYRKNNPLSLRPIAESSVIKINS
jgi:hypothetical protein